MKVIDEATRLNAGNWTHVQRHTYDAPMRNEPLERALVDVLFSFMQAEHLPDSRLIARLLRVSQRDLLSAVVALAGEGLLVLSTGELTPRGIEKATAWRRTGGEWMARAA